MGGKEEGKKRKVFLVLNKIFNVNLFYFREVLG